MQKYFECLNFKGIKNTEYDHKYILHLILQSDPNKNYTYDRYSNAYVLP
jgi:hypothetical protein